MKILNLKKGAYYKCTFEHTGGDGKKYTILIDKENKCSTKSELVAELKRIKQSIEEMQPQQPEQPIEEIELTKEEIEEIKNLALA